MTDQPDRPQQKPPVVGPERFEGPKNALPAPSAWQHAAREEPDEDDDNAVFKSDLPPDLQFEPVPRRARRTDGFTPDRQRAFIAALAACGSVRLACKKIGCSNHAMHKLRHSAGAESFSAAWDNAVARGVRRILDVMVDNAVNGTPEYLYQNGQLVAERRRFNTRSMMWLVAHYMPDRFAVDGGLMHQPGNPAQLARLKQQWQREWYEEQRAKRPKIEDVRASIMEKVQAIERPKMIALAQDPEKRAAYELINGPVDWSRYE